MTITTTRYDIADTIVEDKPDERLHSSLGKAIAILDAFEGASSALGVSELARRTGLTKSTAFRLLSTLVRLGYLERRDSDYCLGRRLFELGNQISYCRPRALRDVALPYLCDLLNATGGLVHLAVLRGTDVLYIEKLHSHNSVTSPSHVGSRLPARWTALGKAMLAFSDPSLIREALSSEVIGGTKHTIRVPHLFLEELANVRRDGIAYDREEIKLGLTCVAAPIVRRDTLIGAISVSGATPQFVPESYAARVRDTAKMIARSVPG